MFQLTEQQEKAKNMALSFFAERNPDNLVFKIGGYAGTGKTTMLKATRRQLEQAGEVLGVGAFTGKAAYNMRSKGMRGAKTIHSMIYEYDEDLKEFFLKPSVPYTGFVLDESSMIGREMLEDLLSFGLPILAVGDPGQLEPVADGDVNLMGDCDIVLEEIMRQAEDNPIIAMSNSIRKGVSLKDCADSLLPEDERVRLVSMSAMDAYWPDIIICGFNNTRHRMNSMSRAAMGFDTSREPLVPREKIIVLQNNSKIGVFNGQLLEIESILNKGKDIWSVVAVDVDDGLAPSLELDVMIKGLGGQLSKQDLSFARKNNKAVIDYGYCITCHKAQGSEWDKVFVVDEQWKKAWEPSRWRYTAYTRASKELAICRR